MGVIEGFTDVIISDKPKEEKDLMLRILFFALLVRLLFIYIVTVFLWPYVMPKLFKGVTPNPSFLQVLALSIMLSMII
tara:strand:- start:5139 stop:5372 length:234 start_codon:yes stop_codon:yes gene_type:complete